MQSGIGRCQLNPAACSPVVLTLLRETGTWFWNSSGKGEYTNRVFCIWRSLWLPQTNVLIEESFKCIFWGACSTWNASHLWTPTSLTSMLAVRCLKNPYLGLSNFRSNNFTLHHSGWISPTLVRHFRRERDGGVIGIRILHSGIWVPVFFLKEPMDLTPASDRLLEETQSINLC